MHKIFYKCNFIQEKIKTKNSRNGFFEAEVGRDIKSIHVTYKRLERFVIKVNIYGRSSSLNLC
jgi:hypothetical protein